MEPLKKLIQGRLQDAQADATPGTQVVPVSAHPVDHAADKATAV